MWLSCTLFFRVYLSPRILLACLHCCRLLYNLLLIGSSFRFNWAKILSWAYESSALVRFVLALVCYSFFMISSTLKGGTFTSFVLERLAFDPSIVNRLLATVSPVATEMPECRHGSGVSWGLVADVKHVIASFPALLVSVFRYLFSSYWLSLLHLRSGSEYVSSLSSIWTAKLSYRA